MGCRHVEESIMKRKLRIERNRRLMSEQGILHYVSSSVHSPLGDAAGQSLKTVGGLNIHSDGMYAPGQSERSVVIGKQGSDRFRSGLTPALPSSMDDEWRQSSAIDEKVRAFRASSLV
jgi:hypothetical protein